MRRIALVAHYDRSGEVKPYVLLYLRSLTELCERVTLVANSPLASATVEEVGALGVEVMQRENEGYDFGAWRHALARTDLSAADELLLTNDTLLGPVRPLSELFDEMASSSVDFWGLTECRVPAPHFQSFFLVFRRDAFRSSAFARFWDAFLPYKDKTQIILSHEIGFSRWLTDMGLRGQARFPYADISRVVYGDRWPLVRRTNPAYYFPVPLLEMGMPFVKVEAMRGLLPKRETWFVRRHAEAYRQKLIREALAERGYDLSLIETAGPPRPPGIR